MRHALVIVLSSLLSLCSKDEDCYPFCDDACASDSACAETAWEVVDTSDTVFDTDDETGEPDDPDAPILGEPTSYFDYLPESETPCVVYVSTPIEDANDDLEGGTIEIEGELDTVPVQHLTIEMGEEGEAKLEGDTVDFMLAVDSDEITLILEFYAVDAAGNKSNTVSTIPKTGSCS